MCDSDQAQETKFEEVMTKIIAYKEIRLQGGDALVNLNIEPYEVLTRKKH